MVPGVRDGFQLEQPNIVTSCQDNIFNATETYCLLPNNAILDVGMCALSLQTNLAPGFFERLIRGEIQHPDDMIAIWEGPNLTSPSTLAWIDVPTATPMHVDLSGGDYVGFKGVGNDGLQDFAVSNDCNAILFIQNSQAFQGDSDGLLRPINGLFGADGDTQSVVCNSSGKVRAAIFLKQAWIFMNNTWNKTQNLVPIDVQYQNAKIWETSSDVFVGLLWGAQTSWGLDIFQLKDNVSNPDSALVPVFRGGQSGFQANNFRAGFMLLTPLNNLLICSTCNNFGGGSMLFHQFDLVDFKTPPVYNKWSFTDPALSLFLENNPQSWRSEAVCTGDLANPYLQCAAVLNKRLRMVFQLQAIGTVTNVNVILEFFQTNIRLRDNITHTQRLSLLSDTIYNDAMWMSTLVISNQNNSFPLDDLTTQYIFTISPDAKDVWIFRNGQLFRLHTVDPPLYGDAWTQSFNMYQADQTKVSDFGMPDVNKDVWMPGTRWFLGTNTLNKPVPLQLTFPAEVARSPHSSFRIELQKPTQDTNPISFLYAVCKIQRVNEFVLAEHAQVRLYNDGNFDMRTLPEDVNPMWDPRLQDIASPSPTAFSVFDMKETPFAVVSPNGQYILYVSKSSKLRLVDNAWNAKRFSDWCQQEPERFDRALQIQSNFCWNSLKITNPTNSLNFRDERCVCIGGPRLFALMFPHSEQVPQGMLAPMEENIPCVANGCSTSFAADTITTNVKKYFQDRCQGRIFNVCQAALEIASHSDFINVDYVVPQNCTTNQIINCKENKDCGPGMMCNNGNCVASCKSTLQCHQFAGNTFTSCISGICQQALHTQPPSIWTPLFISVVIAAAVFLALVLLLLGLLGKRNASR